MLRDRLPSYLLLTYLLLCGCAAPQPDAPSAYDSAVALQNQKSQYAHTLIDSDTGSAYAQADRAVTQVTDGARGIVLQMVAEQPPKAH